MSEKITILSQEDDRVQDDKLAEKMAYASDRYETAAIKEEEFNSRQARDHLAAAAILSSNGESRDPFTLKTPQELEQTANYFKQRAQLQHETFKDLAEKEYAKVAQAHETESK